MSKNKDNKKQFKPEGKIKHMLRTNYWLTPLLLVALVFAIVFGISKIPNLKTTVQGWFNKHEKCKQCEQYTFEDFTNKIESSTGDEVIYVLFSESDNEQSKSLFKTLDKFLKTNKKDANITIISIDLTKKDNDYKDKTISVDNLNKLQQTFLDTLDKGSFTTPSIIKYEGKDMKDALTGAASYNDLMDFFKINKK